MVKVFFVVRSSYRPSLSYLYEFIQRYLQKLNTYICQILCSGERFKRSDEACKKCYSHKKKYFGNSEKVDFSKKSIDNEFMFSFWYHDVLNVRCFQKTKDGGGLSAIEMLVSTIFRIHRRMLLIKQKYQFFEKVESYYVFNINKCS